MDTNYVDIVVHDIAILLVPIHATVLLTTDLIAAGDIVVLLDHLVVEIEDIDVLLLVSIKEEVVVDALVEVLVIVLEDVVVDHLLHHYLFSTNLMIGILREEEEEEVVDLLHHPYLKKIEIEEPCLSLNWLHV
jgi:hypothetical protein